MLALCLSGCDGPTRVAATGEPLATLAFGEPREVSPVGEAGEVCHDVGAMLACFGVEDSGRPRVVSAPAMPEVAPPDAQWRCSPGPPRSCALVRRRPFVCTDGVCRQRHPRVPDDADWECADVEGLVVCRDRAPPAAMVAGPRELGWFCGQLEGGPRLCVDLSPDRPGAGSYECRFTHEPVLERTCRPRDDPTLGAPCRDTCPTDMVCTSGICVPRTLAVPDCWTDVDCQQGERCSLAHCVPPNGEPT